MKRKEIEDQLRTFPIASWGYPRILVGVPLERTISHASLVFHRFLEIAAQGVTFLRQDYTRTDLARNRFAIKLLESDFTHLLMLDVDHVHPRDIIQKLARWVLMNPEIEVVGGLNFRRSEPYEPCCFFKDPETGGVNAPADWGPGLLKVDYIGTGSILISREVFEKIEPPWFYNIYGIDANWADEWPGEDIGFSEKCQRAGVNMYVDTTCTSPHVSDRLIGEATFRSYLEQHPEKYRTVTQTAAEKATQE
jgi:hypothetical protein